MPTRNSRQDSFIDRYADFAIAVSEVTGIAPEVVLGQTALETGWGKSVAGGNMFGIKGQGQQVVTHEDIPGRGMVKTTESFRSYTNPMESFADYGRLMGTSRYNGIGPNQTVGQQVAAIGKSGYATDRNYASKLGGVVDIIQDNKVFQDKVVSNVAGLAPAIPDTFTGVGLPTGAVEFAGDLPDLTPQENFPSAGFDFASIDPGSYTLGDIAPDIEQSFAFNGFSTQPAPAGFSMDQSQFNDVFNAGFPAAPEAFGPSMNEMGQPQEAGYVSGLDAGPWGQTPDFSAPSLDQRNADTLAQDRIKSFESGLVPGFRQNDINQLNDNLMAELGQPALATAPLSAQPTATTAPTQSPNLSSMPMGDLSFDTTVAPATAPQTHSLAPSTSPVAAAPKQDDGFSLGPIGYSAEKGLTVNGFSSPMDAIKSGLGLDTTVKNDAFMNGMASPDYARAYSPGFMDGPIGRGLSGAVQGGMFGGLPGAALGATLGATGWGNQMSNQVSDFFGGMLDHALQGWDNYDFATHGYGLGFNSLGERSHTGMDKSGNATMGDGSYSDQAGYNDNNPQGIL